MTHARVALLHWGDLIEDYLASAGISLQAFREELTGGWMFGYVDALARVGVETVLVCVSREVTAPVRTRHEPTGATLVLLPAPRAYATLRRRLRDPYAWSAREAVGDAGLARLALGEAARELAPYAATPLAALRRVLRSERCHAVLCQEYEHPRFDACVLLGRLLRLPVLATFQGGSTQRVPLERPIRPLALRACNGLVIGSTAEIRRVRNRYRVPAEKIARIFNPLDTGGWGSGDRGAARAELGFGPETRVVAWHGRVSVRHKGLDLLLDAWRALLEAERGRDLRLLLVGGGDDAADLRARIGADGIRDVHWIDEYVLDRARLRRLLASADVYAFPSRWEGFPVAPVEAMACGVPVVAAAVDGIEDILEQGEGAGGVVVPPEDATALAAALRELVVDDPRRLELGRRAAARARDAFSPEAVGAQLRDFLVSRGMRTGP